MGRILKLSVILLMSLCSQLSAQTPQIIYVKKGSTGLANGTSWTNAYPELRTALAAVAGASGNKEIWVSKGEYKPTDDLDQTKSFSLLPDTKIYGGFFGTEANVSQRNWKTNRTVLSGDIGIALSKQDNSHHVVIANSVGTNSWIDGFIIKEGFADSETREDVGGGGLYIYGLGGSISSPHISNCEFIDNIAKIGGAIFIYTRSNEVIEPEIMNCSFNGNYATIAGGGIASAYVETTAVPPSTSKVFNCSFSSNRSDQIGGAIMTAGHVDVINCTIVGNVCKSQGPAFYSHSGNVTLRNSIIWGNYREDIQVPPIYKQASLGTLVAQNNIIEGGYGAAEDNNIDSDPMLVEKTDATRRYPRAAVLPVSTTTATEGVQEYNGSKMVGAWPYYAYKDHQYKKIYLAGSGLQVLNFASPLVNGKPTSTLYTQVGLPRPVVPKMSIHNASNTIYFASYYAGLLYAMNRESEVLTSQNLLAGEPITVEKSGPNDIVVDNVNNKLYCPVFYNPGFVFYGILELNLITQEKKWITTTTPTTVPSSSLSVKISTPVATRDDDAYWGGLKLHLDEVANVLYFSTGNGVWWWDRSTNATGVYHTQGGIPGLLPGSPNLPSNLATRVFVDHEENKVYIGTHAGLFVWNRSNNTSRVYNTSNSKLIHNLINTIDKNEQDHLIYAACENGGTLIINTVTGEEQLIAASTGEIYPKYIDNSSASAFYDELDQKLYVSADHSTGGTWVYDYEYKLPDFGDLRLQAGSPAIDRGNASFLPSGITLDLDGLTRLVDFANIFESNSLDLGAYEKPFSEEDNVPEPIPSASGLNYVTTYKVMKEGVKDKDAVDNFPVNDVNRTTQYIDGLGRPVQSVTTQGSPSKMDVVQPVAYDEFGREAYKYLPYTDENNGHYKPTAIADQATFYSTASTTVKNDNHPFARTEFENSPLNRVLKQGAPGTAWQPNTDPNQDHSIGKQYLSNVSEEVLRFRYDHVTSVTSAKQGNQWQYYSPNELFVNVTVDEEKHAVREYVNKEGQVILKRVQATESAPSLTDPNQWASTYYVYDDFGNLVFVLSPEGVNQYLNLQN